LNNKLKGNFMLLLTAIIWGTSFIATKSGVESMGPFAFNSIRSFIGGLTLLPIILLFKRYGRLDDKGEKKSDLIVGGVLCGLALFFAGAFQQLGIVYTTVGKAGFITAMYVVLVPVIQVLFGKKVKIQIWVCVIMALVGFCLLCMPEFGQIGIGDLLIFAAAIFFAVHILVIDYYVDRVDSIKLSCIQFFSCGAIAILGIILDQTFGVEPLRVNGVVSCALPLLYSGVLSCGVAYTLQVVAQKKTNSILASLILSLESVFAVISGMLIFGERMVAREMIGCIIIFAAVISAQFFSDEKNI